MESIGISMLVEYNELAWMKPISSIKKQIAIQIFKPIRIEDSPTEHANSSEREIGKPFS